MLLVVAMLASSAASASSCGGKGERACCVGERKGGACDSGLHEEPGCKGDCKCGGSIFSSSGTCRAKKKASTKASPCGGKGERACCIGERKGTSCDEGLIEVPGCKGDCECGNNDLWSSGTCATTSSVTSSLAKETIQLLHEDKLAKLIGSDAVKRLKKALTKTIRDPENEAKWKGMMDELNKRVPQALAIIAQPKELTDKIQRDLEPFVDNLAHAVKDQSLAERENGELIGTLLVAAAEGRFTGPEVQKAAAKLAAATRSAFLLTTKAKLSAASTKQTRRGVAAALTAEETLIDILPQSFGVSIGWAAGAHWCFAGGYTGGFGFVADFDPNEEIYDIRAVFDVGEEFGFGGKAAIYDLGIAALYHLYPSKAKHASGPSFGVVASGGAVLTANADIEWGFYGKQSLEPGDVGVAVPGGYSVLEGWPAVGIGAGIQLDPGAAGLIHLGYAVTFGRPGTGGRCDASGCWDLGF